MGREWLKIASLWQAKPIKMRVSPPFSPKCSLIITIMDMHIGIDCRLPYYQMGGISQYVLNLMPALASVDQANHYTVFHSRKDGRSHHPNAPHFSRQNLWTPCHHRFERWALTAELMPYNLDVLHSPDFIPPFRGAKRHVVTVHDLNFIYYPQYLTAESLRYYAGQIAWAVRRADHISADSHATRLDLIDRLHVPPEKVTTVHLSVNPVYQRPFTEDEIDKTLAKYKLPHGFILFVGTLEPRKNIPTLIRAYNLLRHETAVDVPLILVGRKGWKYQEIFSTIQELGLAECVIHLSGVYDESLAHLYHAAGLLVTPSYFEGFGLPTLEAMNCGCPAIVSRRGSLPEIVGPNGEIVDDPDDTAEWAARIGKILTDTSHRQKLIIDGFEQAASFSWQKAAKMTLQIYNGLGKG